MHTRTCKHMHTAHDTHRYMLETLKKDLKPRDITTYKAFENTHTHIHKHTCIQHTTHAGTCLRC